MVCYFLSRRASDASSGRFLAGSSGGVRSRVLAERQPGGTGSGSSVRSSPAPQRPSGLLRGAGRSWRGHVLATKNGQQSQLVRRFAPGRRCEDDYAQVRAVHRQHVAVEFEFAGFGMVDGLPFVPMVRDGGAFPEACEIRGSMSAVRRYEHSDPPRLTPVLPAGPGQSIRPQQPSPGRRAGPAPDLAEYDADAGA